MRRTSITSLIHPLMLAALLLIGGSALLTGCNSDPANPDGALADSTQTVPEDSTAAALQADASEAQTAMVTPSADSTTSAGRRVGDMTLNQAGDVVQNIGFRVFWALVLMVLVYL